MGLALWPCYITERQCTWLGIRGMGGGPET